ncbi:hypothetical protein [Asanoa sp. NPDC050611]|uniref:hypothetical protein n=1 Tax=Asanoa sp. NPDC050611 TaxID=3157098 RepID=UPI0033E3EA8E
MGRGTGRLIRKALAFLRKPPKRSARRPSLPKPAGPFAARPITRDRHGFVSDGRYRVNSKKNLEHTHGQGPPGKSTFYPGTDVDRLTLDAAQRADHADLWDTPKGGKAKVRFAGDIGTHHKTGQPTNVVNVYRRRSGTIHAAPGSRLD